MEDSVRFIHNAVNAIASRKHDSFTEQVLADAIDRELLILRARISKNTVVAELADAPALRAGA